MGSAYIIQQTDVLESFRPQDDRNSVAEP